MMRTRDKMLHFVVVAALLAAAFLTPSAAVSQAQTPDNDKPDTAKPITPASPETPQSNSATLPPSAAQPEKIRLQLHWYPQAQFAGYLMADKKGFFSSEGLNVEIIWGGADVMPLKELRSGDVDFCSAWLSQAIASRTNDDTPCVLLAQLMPKSSMMLVARKSSNIENPVQMTGKKIGAWGGDFSIAPTAFFEKYDIKPIIVMQSSSVLPFVKGVVDIASAMYYNEYHKFMEAGIKAEELQTFMLADYGLDFPEDGLYTTQEFRKNHPDICRKITSALQKGWQYSFENKEETIDVILQAAAENNFITNANHQKWMIDAMQKLIPIKTSDGHPWGYLANSTYQNVCDILQHQKLLKNSPPPYDEFYQPATASADSTPASAKKGGDEK